MEDNAHRLTDEKLEEIEKRLSDIYSRKAISIKNFYISTLDFLSYLLYNIIE